MQLSPQFLYMSHVTYSEGSFRFSESMLYWATENLAATTEARMLCHICWQCKCNINCTWLTRLSVGVTFNLTSLFQCNLLCMVSLHLSPSLSFSPSLPSFPTSFPSPSFKPYAVWLQCCSLCVIRRTHWCTTPSCPMGFQCIWSKE